MLMRKTLAFLLLLLLVGLHKLDAQTPPVESPARGWLPEWSSTSNILVYQNLDKQYSGVTPTHSDIFMNAPYWEEFNPQTLAWRESSVWPLYPNLSAAEQAIFQSNGFIRISPDGQLLVYPSLSGKLTVANRLSQQVFETNIDYSVPNPLPIWWSEDGNGVAIRETGESEAFDDPIIYYVKIINRQNLAQSQIYSVQLAQPLTIGNRVYTPVEQEQVLDVHQHTVLTTMSDLTNFGNSELTLNQAQSHLVIWNPENPQASVIIDAFNGRKVQAAAFVPSDAQQILVVLGNEQEQLNFPVKEGLYRYNIQTHDLKFLTSFDTYYLDTPVFSPDGNWLAIEAKAMSKYAFFRTSDLLSLSPLGIMTPFPTYTYVPTYTSPLVETPTPAQ
jgi:hypothetical protein